MKIKTQILVPNLAMVVFAVVSILCAVWYILDRNIDRQSQTLLQTLYAQSMERVETNSRLLQRLMGEHVQGVKRATADFCLDRAVREGAHKGQWKSVFAQAQNLGERAGIDFLVVFDAHGKVVVAWPSQLDAPYVEAKFKESLLFKSFAPWVDAEDISAVPVFSEFEQWPQAVCDSYGVHTRGASDTVVVSAGIIPNDYFDEPLGYALVGISSGRFQKPAADFTQITGHIAILVDGEHALAWSGLPGRAEEIDASLKQIREGQPGGALNDDGLFFRHGDQDYRVHAHLLSVLSGPTTFVSAEAVSVLMLSGENSRAFTEAGNEIRRSGERTQTNVLYAALLLALVILALSIFVMNLVGDRISRPIRNAADISDEIARGDLEHSLDISGADETGRLSRSINEMINSLKGMRARNETHLKAIEAGKERIEKILGTIQEGVIIVDADTHLILDVNPAAVAMIRAGRDEIIGNAFHHYIIALKAPDHPESYNVYELLTRDGGRLPIYKTSVPITLEEGPCLLETFLDITPMVTAQAERQKLETQLQKAQKMEAIGMLAGGVAHDLNNVLSGIVSYPDLMLMQMSEDNPLHKGISTIKRSGEKAAHIVQDLLTLARRAVANTEVVNLNRVVEEYLHSPEYEKLKTFHPDVEVRFERDEALPNILGSPLHLSKTIMNLVTNAAEAMPDGGRIVISTEKRGGDSNARPDGIKAGDYVALSVADTGIGISAEDQERIFEPFYTKKVMGRSGTGLGMAVVWGTVTDHQGYIDVQSAEGEGSRFTLFFPATRDAAKPEEVGIAIDAYRGAGQSILVVDDVKDQREIAALILARLGYRVDTVASGEAAVAYLRNTPADLLILDMEMDSGMDGFDTYQQAAALRPGQRAIIASGFSETERVKGALRSGVGLHVKKPYTIRTIGMAVWNELNRPEA